MNAPGIYSKKYGNQQTRIGNAKERLTQIVRFKSYTFEFIVRKLKHSNVSSGSFLFFFYLFRCPTSYERAQNTGLHR